MIEIKPGTVLHLEPETPRTEGPRDGRCFKCEQLRPLFAFWVDTMPWEPPRAVWLCTPHWSAVELWCEEKRDIRDLLPRRAGNWDSFADTVGAAR